MMGQSLDDSARQADNNQQRLASAALKQLHSMSYSERQLGSSSSASQQQSEATPQPDSTQQAEYNKHSLILLGKPTTINKGWLLPLGSNSTASFPRHAN
jgi:hypothetical protein